MSAPLRVDVWSDIACPWCYIGKRKFEAAVAAFDGEVELTYRSYELAPDTPVDFEGSSAEFLSRHKGIPLEQAQQMQRQVTEIAADVGLDYDLGSSQHTKTLKAHELLHYAKSHGRQLDVAERLFAAYFEQGRHVGRIDDLADLAAEAGLDRAETVAVLESAQYADDVQADIDQAVQFGIGGVPFYVIDGRLGVSGAQSPEVFEQALRRAAEETSP